MAYTKTIVCLANSRKPGGRCVAGKESLATGWGGWIRPVSARPTAEISLEERRYENGGDPQILDIVQVEMIAAVPRVHQVENHMIDPNSYWSRTGAVAWADIPALADRPPTLWLNGDHTYHGVNDRVSQQFAPQLEGSLFLIRPESVNIQVQLEGGMFGPAKRRVRADFRYNGIGYNFIVTDPLAEQVFLGRENGVYPLNNVYLCVSLTEPYDGDRSCHKLVATIISNGAY